MSKNVAVFVDVANIFYAAKAAGVDIDYVTLLKAATAGRDFVRAYAYTGLDPENENQRQFHSFLSRSGYRVISKDIRKYGDGRIKANLDIELVVDMMKTARNLDIAVVVSGDGDFAPAVRAVQEMGVRVEVISFRGNTSSDLIDVADQFTDIAQIARVEKSSARSGRRVAAEGDLSMTEVPEKETEGAPRRRRGGRAREERVVADTDAQGGNLIVLPGERLSRAPDEESAEEVEPVDEGVGEEGEAAASAAEDGRRRRRRRGGRGRGRGRRTDEGVPVMAEEQLAGGSEEEEEFEELPPAQPPHQTFGSVWDSQLGVPTGSVPVPVESLGGDYQDEEDLEEPEVPEYLLAERRQRGQRQGGGRSRPQRGRSAYQAALDRERYGRGAPQPSFGGGGRGQERGQERGQDRGRDRGRGGRQQQAGRQQRPPRSGQPAAMTERGSSEPWSEVPPELEELLRAELTRKQTEPAAAEPAPSEPVHSVAEGPAEPKPARRRRTTKAEEPTPAAAAAAEEVVAEAPAKKATRSRTSKTTATAKPRTRKAASAKAPSATETGADASDSAGEEPKPARRRRTTKAAEATPAGEEG